LILVWILIPGKGSDSFMKDRFMRKIRNHLQPLVNSGRALIDFILPPECPGCRERMATATGCCPVCQQHLIDNAEIKFWSGKESFSHLDSKLYFSTALTFWNYLPEVETIIHLIKYEGRTKLGVWMGEFITANFLSAGKFPEYDLVIPMPLHIVRKRERGYNQSEMIARGLFSQKELNDSEYLARVRKTATQTALGAEERQENVIDAFQVKNIEKIQGKKILIIDDVITTGATLNSAAKVLLAAGAGSVNSLALARPLLKGQQI